MDVIATHAQQELGHHLLADAQCLGREVRQCARSGGRIRSRLRGRGDVDLAAVPAARIGVRVVAGDRRVVADRGVGRAGPARDHEHEREEPHCRVWIRDRGPRLTSSQK